MEAAGALERAENPGDWQGLGLGRWQGLGRKDCVGMRLTIALCSHCSMQYGMMKAKKKAA